MPMRVPSTWPKNIDDSSSLKASIWSITNEMSGRRFTKEFTCAVERAATHIAKSVARMRRCRDDEAVAGEQPVEERRLDGNPA